MQLEPLDVVPSENVQFFEPVDLHFSVIQNSNKMCFASTPVQGSHASMFQMLKILHRIHFPSVLLYHLKRGQWGQA